MVDMRSCSQSVHPHAPVFLHMRPAGMDCVFCDEARIGKYWEATEIAVGDAGPREPVRMTDDGHE